MNFCSARNPLDYDSPKRTPFISLEKQSIGIPSHFVVLRFCSVVGFRSLCLELLRSAFTVHRSPFTVHLDFRFVSNREQIARCSASDAIISPQKWLRFFCRLADYCQISSKAVFDYVGFVWFPIQSSVQPSNFHSSDGDGHVNPPKNGSIIASTVHTSKARTIHFLRIPIYTHRHPFEWDVQRR